MMFDLVLGKQLVPVLRKLRMRPALSRTCSIYFQDLKANYLDGNGKQYYFAKLHQVADECINQVSNQI